MKNNDRPMAAIVREMTSPYGEHEIQFVRTAWSVELLKGEFARMRDGGEFISAMKAEMEASGKGLKVRVDSNCEFAVGHADENPEEYDAFFRFYLCDVQLTAVDVD